MRISRTAAVVLLAGSAALSLPAAETHPFSVHDMLAMQRISDPRISPDGRRIVFCLRSTDLEANRGRTDLWMVGVDGRGLRRMTSHPGADFNPRWSPDGEYVWFLSSRSGSVQVWRIRTGGGEARPVTDLPLDVGNLLVSPAGTHIAFTVEVFPDHPTPGATSIRMDEIAKRPASGRIFDQVFIRHWDTWRDGRRSNLFVMKCEDGRPRNLMPGMQADTPSRPFGGPEEITFSPDGRFLVFTARDAGREEAWSTDFDLYSVPVDGSAPPICLTEENPAWDTAPVFSPDGKILAYSAMKRPGYESDRFRIMLKSWPAGPARELAGDWDRSPSSLTWAPDGSTLYATAPDRGRVALFAVDAGSGDVRLVFEGGHVASPSPAGENIIFSLDTLQSPAEIYSIRTDGEGLTAVTSINADRIAAARMGDFEQFTFSGAGGDVVFAYIVRPVDFDETLRYPVAFLIHGGPQGSFGNSFHYRWNPQVYAGAGYACVMVDFHGSVGYGQAFTDAINGDWGGKPLVDLQKGLAEALRRYPWMDGERVGALGASYGGYMINWIAGNWPDRFRCLINHDGNLDERMAYYNTEELWFPEWEHGGPEFDNPRGYAKHNPVDFIKNWKTPMLVIHGAHDFRVVETQGMATFNALQRRGIPSRFLYFPDENHWVLKPHNSILWHDTVIGWLDSWCRK